MAEPTFEITPAAGWDGLADALERLAAAGPAGAAPGDARVLRLAAGDYTGDRPLRLPVGLTLDGSAGARLCWTGRGSALRLIGAGSGPGADAGPGRAALRGLTIEAAGPFPDPAPEQSGDALILIQDTAGLCIEGCCLRGGAEHLHGLLVRGCTDIHIWGCAVSGCRSGILIASSLGVEASGNRCHGNRRNGLAAALDSGHPERPCHCRFIDNRCHDNLGSGIAFTSSWGQAAGNDCWGNAHGITLQRDPKSPEAPAIADLSANRCHDNQQSGIGLLSSAARAAGNDCWGNAHGITLQRDPKSPAAPAIADLSANRCHENQYSGIALFSSAARAAGNDCWGNAYGIALQRDANSPETPAIADLSANRCHDNQKAGIGFVSSWGRAADNDCWGNAHGIVLQRDPKSPAAPAIADLSANRCHENQQSGIALFSSAARAAGNDCWGNAQDSIALSRDPNSPEVPAIADLSANRCHDNQGSGIALFSSAARAAGNDCWGNAVDGIVLRRDPNSPAAPAIADLSANRCHDNQQSGIGLLSSAARAAGNDCWGNAHGITLQRDPKSPAAPAIADLSANRCHENQYSGIALFSSAARAAGNDCWGNAYGIALQRDANSPETPAIADLSANRCHDNQKAGIGFVSSWGRAADNDCWGNAHGIVLQRDPKSPAAPAIADLSANRCHDNQQSGIALFSSAARAAGNDCWGNTHGIALSRDPNSPEVPAIADLSANRCHDNQGSGIVLHSSAARAAGNDCWRNADCGIRLQRDPNSPEAPAIADLSANRCHDNQQAGIALFSSAARAADNDCWGNVHGIALQRDQNSPAAPAIADLSANRCHDNQQSGIGLFSSAARAAGNDCWGNTHGIALQRDANSPETPAIADLSANRCHDNQQSGIGLFSSAARAAGNDCWGNAHGITLQRAPKFPAAPAIADLSANRCDHNHQVGIRFFSSDGHCDANQCWHNGLGDGIDQQRQSGDPTRPPFMTQLPDCRVRIDRHGTGSPDPAVTLAARRDARPDRALVAALAAIAGAGTGPAGEPGTGADANEAAYPGPDQATALADFLGSGCVDCFGRFWFGARPAAPAAGAAAPGPITGTGEGPRVYALAVVKPGLVALTRLPPTAGDAGAPAGARARLGPTLPAEEPLGTLLAAFADLWLTVRERGWAAVPAAARPAGRPADPNHPGGRACNPVWNLAWVDADRAGLDAELTALADAAPERAADWAARWAAAFGEPLVAPPRLGAPLVLDLGGAPAAGRAGRRASPGAAAAPGQPSGHSLDPPADPSTDPAAALTQAVARALLVGRGAAGERARLLLARWGAALPLLLLLPVPLVLGLLWYPDEGRLPADLWTAATAGGGASGWAAGLASGLGTAWAGLKAGERALWVACAAAAPLVWLLAPNLLLPAALRLRLPGSTALLNGLDQAVTNGVFGALGRGLQGWLARREWAALRRWLGQRLCGGATDLRLLVLRGTATLGAADAAALRRLLTEVMDRRGPRRGFLVLVQLDDLAHLRTGWLGQVLGQDGPTAGVRCAAGTDRGPDPRPDPRPATRPDNPWDRLLLVHRPTAAALIGGTVPAAPGAAPSPPAPGGGTAAAPPHPRPAERLGAILGAVPGAPVDADQLAGALLDPRWTPLDLLPALVLGSTPALPVVLTGEYAGESQYGPDWARELAPFRALFAASAASAAADAPLSAPLSAAVVADLKTMLALAQTAGGIQPCTIGSDYPYWQRLTGLPGARAALAAALADCCGGRDQAGVGADAPEDWRSTAPTGGRPVPRPTGRDDRHGGCDAAAPPPARAAAYLARLVAGGEIYHLLRCVESLTGRPLGEPIWADPGADRGADPDPSAADPRHAGRPPAIGADLPLHLESALSLLTERLALTAAAGPLAPGLAATVQPTAGRAWRALGRALDTPAPAWLWPDAAARDADAGRCCCAWLAALACLDAAAGARPDGLPTLDQALADLDAALAPEADGGAADRGASLRARFHAEVRTMADTLAAVAPEAAAPVLQQRLAQDWARLPPPAAERLRAACLTPAARVLEALAAATDVAGVLAVAQRYQARPALVVAALAAAALGAGTRPGAGDPAPEPTDLAALGAFLLGLHRRIAPAPAAAAIRTPVGADARAKAATPPEQLPPLVPPRAASAARGADPAPPPGTAAGPPEPAAPAPATGQPACVGDGRLAARLVSDPDFTRRLGALLADGEQRRRKDWDAVASMGRIDLEGLALGEYLPAVRVLEEIRLSGHR